MRNNDGDDADKFMGLARQVVGIDELNLDKECIRLPTDYLKFAHASADAKREVDALKLELEIIEAEVSKAIRQCPENYGLEKITETAIKEAVASSSRVRKAQRALIDMKHTADTRQAVVWALEHKKRCLTLLVELHGMSYFSNPKITEKGRQAVEQMTQRSVRGRRRDDHDD